jgi:hypothetical protein
LDLLLPDDYWNWKKSPGGLDCCYQFSALTLSTI